MTPDSFSDGGNLKTVNDIENRSRQMISQGADIIDVGGESTRPGADSVSVQQELDRVMPAIEMLRSEFEVVISVDTSTPEVILEASRSGVQMINDIRALTRPGALEAAAATNLNVCLMHMQGQPKTMQKNPSYRDIVSEVKDYLEQRIYACVSSGISRDRLIIDPGFGFGKSLEHNVALLKNLQHFADMNYPVLVGISRKSMIGQLTGKNVNERLAGSLAAAMLAAQSGANIIRVHDVAETRDVLNILQAVTDI